MDSVRAYRYHQQDMAMHGQLTTLWTGSTVYLVFSGESDDSGRRPRIAKVPAAKCDSSTYVETASGIIENQSPRKTRLVWAVLQESFPFRGSRAGSSHDAGISGTVYESCWRELPQSWLPVRMFDGMEAFKRFFMNSQQLSHPGSCLYFTLGERAYLLGYQDEDVFVRASRIPTNIRMDTGSEGDWLLQSRMLYNNSSGYSISGISVLAPVQNIDNANLSCASLDLVDLASLDGGQLHELEFPVARVPGLLAQLESPGIPPVPTVEDRIRGAGLKTVLQVGTGLVVIGWILFFAAACRSGEFRNDRQQTLLDWENAIHQWNVRNDRWIHESNSMHDRAAKILLTGAISGSIPGTVAIERIRYDVSGKPGGTSLLLHGKILAGASHSEFHSWLDNLVADGWIGEIGNLEFDAVDNGLNFILRANPGRRESKP